ncbi:hypothetical protein C0995_008811 [Termitomyces sp. Mi166|nr:hypothetical protein C0995_008811 [Termitomyces sp. Mi166\
MTNPDNGGYLALSRNPAETQDRLDDEFTLQDTGQEPLLSQGNPKLRGTFQLHPDGRSYSYSYGPKGVAGLLHNYYALLCAFFASIGGLTFGYDQGVIANVLVMTDFMQRWPITPLQKGIMTRVTAAVLELGALLGALGAGILADRYSRRHSIFAACIVFCIGSGFQCGAQFLSHLFIGRAVGGIGVGALSMLSPLYMAEISPPEVRGSLIALEQFSIVLGVVFVRDPSLPDKVRQLIPLPVPSSASWRIPLGTQLIPGVILGLGCLFLPPSPRLLVLHDRYHDAMASLARLRSRSLEEARHDPLLQLELLEMRVEMTLVQRALDDGVTDHDDRVRLWSLRSELKAWKRLSQRKYRDRTWIGVLIMVFQQWSGINALLYYGPTIARNIGLRGDTVTLLVSGGIGIVQFLAVIPAILFIDSAGRKPLLRSGGALMALSHVTIALLVYQFESDWPAHSTAAWAAVGGIYTFTAAYGVSFGPIVLIGLVTPILMDYSPAGTFMVFAIACALAYFWATDFVPETANISLEEVDSVFASSAGMEDAQLKAQVRTLTSSLDPSFIEFEFGKIEEDLGLRNLIRELGAD